jgi:hypothetical protein
MRHIKDTTGQKKQAETKQKDFIPEAIDQKCEHLFLLTGKFHS